MISTKKGFGRAECAADNVENSLFVYLRSMTESKLTDQSGNQFTVPWRACGQSSEPMHIAAASEYDASERDIEAYQTDGVILSRGVFDDWVDRLRAGLERNLEEPGGRPASPHGA